MTTKPTTPTPPTTLGRHLAGQAAPTPPASELGKLLAFGARGELLELPVLGRAWVQLVGHDDIQQIEGLVMRRMKERELELSMVTALSFEAEKAALTLAAAVRSPSDKKIPFGTIEEWGQLDTQLIAQCWSIYGDVVERLAPLDAEMPESRFAEIRAAIAKKNSTVLRSFGVNALATYLATTESLLASSPTTRSSDGDTSSES